jgi:DNA-binding PadR family transcriptional regulator
MSAIDLFLLGYFMEPKRKLREEQKLPVEWSAYDLSKFIQENDLQELLKVSSQAVFKNLVALASKGYLRAEVLHDGAFMEKKRYSVTPKGRAYFDTLMRSLAHSGVKYHFDFNSFIVNLDKVSKKEAMENLDALMKILQNKRSLLKKYEAKFSFIPLPAIAIIRQQIMLNRTLMEWLSDFMNEYGKMV